MQSALFKLKSNDYVKGLITAVIAGIVTYVFQLVNVPGFNLGDVQWGEVFRIATASGMAYLMKNLVTDSDGKVFGAF